MSLALYMMEKEWSLTLEDLRLVIPEKDMNEEPDDRP